MGRIRALRRLPRRRPASCPSAWPPSTARPMSPSSCARSSHRSASTRSSSPTTVPPTTPSTSCARWMTRASRSSPDLGLGLTRNVESMLARARGAYLFLADQDDVWMPAKVETMVDALERGATMVVSDCAVVDAQLRELSPSYFRLLGSGPGFARNLMRNGYLGSCMAFRRELLSAALPFPARPPAHDWWLGMVAEMFGTVRFVDIPLVKYRRHGHNQSSASGRSAASLADRLTRRAQLGGLPSRSVGGSCGQSR